MTSAERACQHLQEQHNVSRETSQKLAEFVGLLEKWNPKINLVSKTTIPEVWDRHILDSAQLYGLIPPKSTSIVDIGTGGGFPGMVLAIMMHETHPNTVVTMIESDMRKCAFLQTTVSQLKINAVIKAQRVESVAPMGAEVLTSRALAPLSKLLGFADRHLAASGRGIFLKGENAEAEIDEALASWQFDLQKKTSETSAAAVVLEISNIRPR